MAELAQKIYDGPWYRVHTDLGRTAWVQVIRTAEPVLVHFYTALSGTRNVLPAPRNPFCVGTGKQIDVHFDAADTFKSYRIERQDGANQPFQTLKTVKKGPFKDKAVAPGSRYVYRITGIAANKAESLPATVGGSTASRGVISGSVNLIGGRQGALSSFDFLTGERLVEGGDITLTGMYGSSSAASFTDSFGIHARPLPGTLAPGYSGWGKQIPPNISFEIRLRGGGVARCLWKPVASWEVLVEYTVNPDAADLDLKPVVTVEKKDGHALVSLAAPEGYEAESVCVTDAESGETRVLTLKNGQARDLRTEGTRFLTYSATCVDRFGRRTAPGTAFANFSPRGIRKGEFRFHYRQAYSIELDKIVPLDEGDMCFASCAGGISSVTLQAAKGITNLEWGDVRESIIAGCTVPDLLDAIVSVDPDTVDFEGRADGDSREPTHDVFILKTRHGGWAKLAITTRSEHRDWQQKPVAVRYVYNAHEPVFKEESTGETVAGHGVTFDVATLNRSREMLASRQQRILAALDRKTAKLASAHSEKTGKEIRVAALLGRSHASRLDLPDDWVASTFSFEFDTRDDRELVRNDWDIAFGNGDPEFDVFGLSSIWDLGAVAFDTVVVEDGHSIERADEVAAIKDHVYVIHSLDSNTDFWAKMQIIDQNRGEWVIFRWEIIDDVEQVIRLERLPELEMKSPVVNIQIRAGASGGGKNRITMDGAASNRVDEVSQRPLDMVTAPNIAERSVGYFKGGLIPEGMVWVVKSIEFVARADGDSNGPGRFSLQVGPFTIAHFRGDPRSERVIYTLDGGARVLAEGEFEVKHGLAMEIPLWPGDEKKVFASVGNSSLCNVVIRGEFVDADAFRGEGYSDVRALDRLHEFFMITKEMDKQNALSTLEKVARENKHILPYLKTIRDVATNDGYRALIEKMIDAASE